MRSRSTLHIGGIALLFAATMALGAHAQDPPTGNEGGGPGPPPARKPSDARAQQFANRVKHLSKAATELGRMCAEKSEEKTAATQALRAAALEVIAEDITARRQNLENARTEELDRLKGRLAALGPTRGNEERSRIQKQIDEVTKAYETAIDQETKKVEKLDVDKQTNTFSTALATTTNKLCDELCSPEAPSHTTPVQFCAFSDETLAAAAIVGDQKTTGALIRYVKARMDAPKLQLVDRSISLSEIVKKRQNLKASVPATALMSEIVALEEKLGQRGAGTFDLAALSMRTADVALAALAKVIEDRAKREGLAWFLEKVHDSICRVPEKPDSSKPDTGPEWQKRRAIQEIREYWLPNTCALASQRGDFMQYGGGAVLLRAVQGAVASDVKQWPGAAAGLGSAALFWADTASNHGCVPNLLACHDEKHNKVSICSAAGRLRAATAKLTNDLMVGTNAAVALNEYGTTIDGLNRNESAFYSNKLQVAACAASMPLVFQEYQPGMTQLSFEPFESTEALLLGALAGTPACFSIVGKGWKTSDCPAFDPGKAQTADKACTGKQPPVTQVAAAAAGGGSLERLTTIIRWHQQADRPTRAIAGRWGVVQKAWTSYESALNGLLADKGGTPFVAPSINVGAVENAKTFAEAMKALENYAQNTARTFQQSKQVKLLQATTALAHAGVDFGVALADAGASLSAEGLYPGICQTSSTCDASKVAFEGGRDALLNLSGKIDTVENALNQDWGKVVPQVIAAISADLKNACGMDPECTHLTMSLSRYAGLFTALATDPDPDNVAKALDAAALPIGGWRRKNVPGTTTISIAAFPGFATALEWRWGQYGVRHEHLEETHGSWPTLTLPLGFDFAVHRWAKFFVSVLDPAAYLQYDAEKQGRLPGAQIITALAPGAAYRFSPWDAPISLNAFFTYRPRLRAWEPAVAGPAADALQLGVSLSVDVTLWDLYTKDPDIGN